MKIAEIIKELMQERSSLEDSHDKQTRHLAVTEQLLEDNRDRLTSIEMEVISKNTQ